MENYSGAQMPIFPSLPSNDAITKEHSIQLAQKLLNESDYKSIQAAEKGLQLTQSFKDWREGLREIIRNGGSLTLPITFTGEAYVNA